MRDAEFLHLYKQAGFERFLMGTENTDEATLKLIRKGGATSSDREAIRLLREHEHPINGHLGRGLFGSDRPRDGARAAPADFLRSGPDPGPLRDTAPLDPLFPRGRSAHDRQPDKTKWDCKHQVLAMSRMPPWRLFLWIKFVEAALQLRPRALIRWLWNPDPKIRHAIRCG